MKLLVIGCPHSGTLFTAKVLRAAGISCGHEAMYTLWGIEPAGADAEAEISWEAVFHLDRDPVDSRIVVAHQTRDPIAWLNSWTRMSEHAGDAAWELLERNYPGILARQRQDPVCTAMWLWVAMNRRCARHAVHRHRVEDLRDEQGIAILGELCRMAGIAFDPALVSAALSSTDRTTNHHPGLPSYVPLTWESLPSGNFLDELKDLARSYGYSPSA